MIVDISKSLHFANKTSGAHKCKSACFSQTAIIK